jgi:hypothetical protein
MEVPTPDGRVALIVGARVFTPPVRQRDIYDRAPDVAVHGGG